MKRRKLRHFDDIPGIQENLDYYATIIENEHERQLKDRIISINTVIDHRIVELAITPLQRFDEDNSGRPIRIIINSEGGSVNDGLPLCDIIDNLKTPTDIICEGKAYSMALYILMSGRNNPNVRRFSYAGSSGLLHAGSEQVSGNVHDVRDTIKFYDKTEELVKNRIIANSNLTLDFLKSIEREQFFMYGKEMLEYGFIDEIIGPSTYLRPTTRRTTRRTINQRNGKYHRKKNI